MRRTATKSSFRFGTIFEFISERNLLNDEHAEAFVRELAGIMGQLVFCAENCFSDKTITSFSKFPSGEKCNSEWCEIWMRSVIIWISQLSDHEGAALASVRFTWS